jgi:hypothetical protein
VSGVAPPPSRRHSAIAPDFPELFEDFRKKQFTLLWHGSRDVFRASDFHDGCDGHPNTLTVILDTKGNISGGFTPVEWESRQYDHSVRGHNWYKADPSLKSWLFTLKNPHNFPARRLALRAGRKDKAISCYSGCGPAICDIRVFDNCNTGLDEKTFFTD